MSFHKELGKMSAADNRADKELATTLTGSIA